MNLRGIRMLDPSPGRRWLWTLLALLASLAAGCDLPGRPRTGDRYVPPENERSFNVLFQKNCVGCHGADGKLGPAPPLNDKLFLALIPDDLLERVIAEGRPGTLMPAFAQAKGGELTAGQVKVLAQGIKPRWGSVEPAPSGAPPYLLEEIRKNGAEAGSKEAGNAVFARACASCHGDQGPRRRDGGCDQRSGLPGTDQRPGPAPLCDHRAARSRNAGLCRSDGRPEGYKALTAQDVTNVTALLAAWRQGGSVDRKGN